MNLIEVKRADQLNPNDYLLFIQQRGDGLEVRRSRVLDLQLPTHPDAPNTVRLALGRGNGQYELELECDAQVVVLGRRPTYT